MLRAQKRAHSALLGDGPIPARDGTFPKRASPIPKRGAQRTVESPGALLGPGRGSYCPSFSTVVAIAFSSSIDRSAPPRTT